MKDNWQKTIYFQGLIPIIQNTEYSTCFPETLLLDPKHSQGLNFITVRYKFPLHLIASSNPNPNC